MARVVLAVDVGGSHVKALASNRRERRRFVSGPTLTPEEMVTGTLQAVAGWSWSRVTVGIPSAVRGGKVVSEPVNLGDGWVGFDYEAAFGVPTKVVNDAVMQAIGSYDGGRMLFLGLGTGLGSALVWDNYVLSLELGDLPYRNGSIIEDYLGKPGLARLGEKDWRRDVVHALVQLKKSLIADYIVLGGGNAKKLDELPKGVERGHNRNAFLGGTRLWQIDSRTRRPKWQIL